MYKKYVFLPHRSYRSRNGPCSRTSLIPTGDTFVKNVNVQYIHIEKEIVLYLFIICIKPLFLAVVKKIAGVVATKSQCNVLDNTNQLVADPVS